jgi:hypothetical protein
LGLLQRGYDYKKCKNKVGSFKNPHKNYWARKVENYMKAY